MGISTIKFEAARIHFLSDFFAAVAVVVNRELKMETFSGRRRPDRQRKPGTEVAVASRQKSNIKIAVNSEGRHL